MMITINNMKKWYRMLIGTSTLHVNQTKGKLFSVSEIKGYYNDLTEKVLKDPNALIIEIPNVMTQDGKKIIFPIAVFQYGLGLYDLYLSENNSTYYEKFRVIANWSVDNQYKNGAWSNFFYIYPENPYSAMAQGEGISVLLRAYIEFGDQSYLHAAKKAMKFLVLPVESGGTALYKGSDIYFQEYTHLPTVLNGWIFALFALIDYLKVVEDSEIKSILEKSLDTLERRLSDFDNGYWSSYNNDESILASLFYHKLHIAQLVALYDLTGINAFLDYSKRWTFYEKRWLNRKKAFIKKAYQKLIE